MKAVGEIMAIGRTFEEALGKALRSWRTGAPAGRDGKDEFDEDHFDEPRLPPDRAPHLLHGRGPAPRLER
jgi:hypothetical protein